MPTFTRGSLIFEKVFVSSSDLPEVLIRTYDCFPPPRGTIAHANPPLEAQVELVASFLQARERALVLEGARKPSDKGLTLSQIISEMAQAFRFEPITIELKNIPAGWDAVVPCFKSTIRYRVYVQGWEITVRTTEEKTLGGETFPKGDVVASFRINQPVSYRFVRRFEWNPRCCGDPPRTRGPEHSDIFPRLEFELPDRGWRFIDPHELPDFDRGSFSEPRFRFDDGAPSGAGGRREKQEGSEHEKK